MSVMDVTYVKLSLLEGQLSMEGYGHLLTSWFSDHYLRLVYNSSSGQNDVVAPLAIVRHSCQVVGPCFVLQKIFISRLLWL